MRGLSAMCAVLVLGACGGPREVGSAGAECYRDDDCAYGLVCAVPEGGKDRVCTDDVSGLISEVEQPMVNEPNGGAPMATAGAASTVAGAGGTTGTVSGAGGATAGTVGAGGTATAGASGSAGSGGRPEGGGAGAPP